MKALWIIYPNTFFFVQLHDIVLAVCIVILCCIFFKEGTKNWFERGNL
jgi:Ca2+/H+ antiporter